jgi:hypothetical protein
MAGPSLEELSPRTLREDKLDLQLDPSVITPRAFSSVLVNVSYERTLPEGVCLPLIFEAQGPSAGSYVKRIFTRHVPSSVVFTPAEGGPHLVTVREAAHNYWWGKLNLTVEGEQLDPPRPL